MPLSQECRDKSLADLINYYQRKQILTGQQITLLKEINNLAAADGDGIFLSEQTDKVRAIIGQGLIGQRLKGQFDESSCKEVASSIYTKVIEQLDREKVENQRLYRRAGNFNQKYIHQRHLKDELQDHDMVLLMPKSHGNIEVLAPINRFDKKSIEAVQQGLFAALKSKQIKHIVIPIGPGHWRSIYLTKPDNDTDNYELELFDPYGPIGAIAIQGIALELLKRCGIDIDKVTVKTTGPTHPQGDSYACGDFTCAYSHKKMQEFGAPNTAYNQELINVLDTEGNRQDALRHKTREVSAKKNKSEETKRYEKNKQYAIATWPPSTRQSKQRHYYDSRGKEINSRLRGRDLPAAKYVAEQEKTNKERRQKLLADTKLFTNLPNNFYQQFLQIQNSDRPFNFPPMGHDKNVTVRDVMSEHSAFQIGGIFHPDNWKNLGWKSKNEYNQWLDTLVLFAFSQCLHYCSVDRIFNCTTQQSDGSFRFDQVSTNNRSPKKTHILSVTGFDYMGFSGTVDKEHLRQIKQHSQFTMGSILEAAQTTNTTDIVLIPYGMGVFIQGRSWEGDVKESILSGMLKALRHYDGPPLVIHCCASDEFYNKLTSVSNPRLTFINKGGFDAYTVANSIEDDPTKPKKKAMLINAADDDWKALLDKTKKPGQLSASHHLYTSASDEYYALVTNLSFYSIQNLIHTFGNTKDQIIELRKKTEKPEFTEIQKRNFLTQLSKILSDPNKLDKAVFERGFGSITHNHLSLTTDTKQRKKKWVELITPRSLSLRELDAYGVFNSDGSINQEVATQYGINFQEEKIKTKAEEYGFKHLSFREMLILVSAVNTVFNDFSINPEIAEICFDDFSPPSLFRFKHPLSMELAGPAREMLGRGYFKFNGTNISISPGPNSARSLSTSNPQLYEAHRDIAGYLNNLLANDVAHVFVMGRILPYYPQASDGERQIRTDVILNDFINYFIPDANGHVILPDIPELKDIQITSRPLKKVGRFITYEISINGSNPIQVHHFPIRDKQPLELTEAELAYVKEISQTTPPQQNIHAHCRGGKGRSAQIAYLLASLTPTYSKLSHEERLAQMRDEKALKRKPEYFIETPLQKDYAKDSGYLIQEDLSSEITHDVHMELYILYGTFLRQEINRNLQLVTLPEKEVEKEHEPILELIEKYQELSSISFNDLSKWVDEVCKNSLVSESTKNLFTFKSATEFLLHAFKERKNPNELALFFELQAKNSNYLEVLKKLELVEKQLRQELQNSELSPDKTQQQLEMELEEYTALFITHLQNAYLQNNSAETKCITDVYADISKTLSYILNAIQQQNPKLFTKEIFEDLQQKYYQCKHRIELLEKNDRNGEVLNLTANLKPLSIALEQMFLLGFDKFEFELEPSTIIIKMDLLYQQLGQLYSANKLSPENWNELKKQFKALKIIFDFTNTDKIETPAIVSTLEKLFQGKREQVDSLFKRAVLNVDPGRESLNNFVSNLSCAVLNTAFEELITGYYSEEAKNSGYCKEINRLIEAIGDLSKTYEKSTEEILDIHQQPQNKNQTAEEYEKARQQVIEFIERYTPPFLITTEDLGVQFENLHRDFIRLKSHSQLMTSEFRELRNRFAELKIEYKNQNNLMDNVSINQVIEKIEAQINSISDVEKYEHLATEHYHETIENSLRVKAMRDADNSRTGRDIQGEINSFTTRVEKKMLETSPYPQPPKLIVFDLDSILIDLKKDENNGIEKLISILRYASEHRIEIALSSNSAPDDEKQALITKLRTRIEAELKINLSNLLAFSDPVSLRKEKAPMVKFFQKKISDLNQYLEDLENQLTTAEDKEKLEETIKEVQSEIGKMSKKLDNLTSDKILHLNAIKEMYEFRKLNSYYQRMDWDILNDFENLLIKNIGINDYTEKKEAWHDLFQLAYSLMQAQSFEGFKSSLQTILTDIIFDADKAERLQNKYGILQPHQEERRKRISSHKDYFSQRLSQIESFYQSRLAYQKLVYERKAVLNEEDIVILDAQQNIEQIRQHHNYRAIKIGDSEAAASLLSLVELNYEMGAYNKIIAYLKGEEQNAPLSCGPKEINKTLMSYLNDNIPNFAIHEFGHTPIVLHVKMSDILRKLPQLSDDKEVQERYKNQFFESAIERYDQLSEELQNDFVRTYYIDAYAALNAVNDKLKELINSPSQQLVEELKKLKAQVDSIIAIDEKFSQRISPTFLSCEAMLLKSMITSCIDTGNLDGLQIDHDKVCLKTAHDETRTKFYIDATVKKPDIYLRESIPIFHPILVEIPEFDQELITSQYKNHVSKKLKEIIDKHCQENLSSALIKPDPEGNYPSLQALLTLLKGELDKLDLKKNTLLFTNLHQLGVIKKLCEALEPIAPYQTWLDNLSEEPKKDYKQQISQLSQQIKTYQREIESSEEYKAKLFLDKAKEYLLTKDWDVGIQWNTHTVKLNGKVKKIPATVAAQLDVIKKAKEGSYQEAKFEYLKLGQAKESTWRSSKPAKNYYSLFANKEELDSLAKDLEQEFDKSKTV
ncbi:hypothetical protein ACQUW5_13680 [Legionella sp. CNM-1927-20]|uniref:hypothetical protein n=1 Tax=Legionella sp. CNM-1927-20 TaxID=3422221 RepID=UPI00403AFE3F